MEINHPAVLLDTYCDIACWVLNFTGDILISQSGNKLMRDKEWLFQIWLLGFDKYSNITVSIETVDFTPIFLLDLQFII